MNRKGLPDDEKEGVFGRLVAQMGVMKRSADQRLGVLSRLVQFGIVGGGGIVVDISFFTLLLYLQVHVGIARMLAICLAMTFNFLGNRMITFRETREVHPLKQYWKFVASCSLGAMISWAVSVGLIYWVPQFYFRPQVCALAGIVVGLISNFTLSYRWVFASDGAATRTGEA
ncbi:MAG: GtrA family protein [Planctomycetota bacterium]